MDPHIQDFEPKVINNTTKNKEQKKTIARPPSVAKITYDDDGNEIVKLKTVSREMAQFIIKARTDKGLKQSDLAKQANLDAKTVAEIERGGGLYNAGQINRIAKVLGVNIPRK